MNNYKLVKDTEWKEVEINGEDKEIPIAWECESLEILCFKIKDGTHGSFKDYEGKDFEFLLSAKNIKNNNLIVSNYHPVRLISTGFFSKTIPSSVIN